MSTHIFRTCLFVSCIALDACCCHGDDIETDRLRKFFSGDRYDVVCFDLVGDPELTAIAERFQAWASANFDVARMLVRENEGGLVPYQESMASGGISREDYSRILDSKGSLQIKEIGEPLSYKVSQDGDVVRLVPKGGEQLRRMRNRRKKERISIFPVSRVLRISRLVIGP